MTAAEIGALLRAAYPLEPVPAWCKDLLEKLK